MKSDQELTQDNLTKLSSLVTDTVSDCLSNGKKASSSLIERLRTYERTARDADLGAQTVQVIASGRRLLGDRRNLSPR
ncbi:hypothetical protein [Methylobacterium oxalidis]|uniref:Uncharacterized protein n=1 Tax=Methylobacterium oxalidis TaxID=944322 RepID=A0A512JCQ1_9HYPH|nr:hypothetical protein [Methylobacterium oxalidis]GEP07687.1 hypothetical protein MOX02_57250 [Methylobacterium oxalidis]GJE35292.1 hypothetical protein LDDCCGHA_5510 [Methylobacterium oxalidis]GLS64865.1 hypothetical protein GCM10007888_32460 [Methylobacterium oxalidis]